MLGKIHSSYITNEVFTYLNEGKKLKIIKYNKSLQQINEINLINYQYFKRKYTVYESNRIGKEYNGTDDNLIFEGEYLNGEKNGKGKEYYYNGKLKFEGEYLNGKRIRKGKEYMVNIIIMN